MTWPGGAWIVQARACAAVAVTKPVLHLVELFFAFVLAAVTTHPPALVPGALEISCSNTGQGRLWSRKDFSEERPASTAGGIIRTEVE